MPKYKTPKYKKYKPTNTLPAEAVLGPGGGDPNHPASQPACGSWKFHESVVLLSFTPMYPLPMSIAVFLEWPLCASTQKNNPTGSCKWSQLYFLIVFWCLNDAETETQWKQNVHDAELFVENVRESLPGYFIICAGDFSVSKCINSWFEGNVLCLTFRQKDRGEEHLLNIFFQEKSLNFHLFWRFWGAVDGRAYAK